MLLTSSTRSIKLNCSTIAVLTSTKKCSLTSSTAIWFNLRITQSPQKTTLRFSQRRSVILKRAIHEKHLIVMKVKKISLRRLLIITWAGKKSVPKRKNSFTASLSKILKKLSKSKMKYASRQSLLKKLIHQSMNQHQASRIQKEAIIATPIENSFQKEVTKSNKIRYEQERQWRNCLNQNG